MDDRVGCMGGNLPLLLDEFDLVLRLYDVRGALGDTQTRSDLVKTAL